MFSSLQRYAAEIFFAQARAEESVAKGGGQGQALPLSMIQPRQKES